MRSQISRSLAAGATALACGLGLIACSGGGGTSSNVKAGAIVEDAGPPQDGGVINVAATADASSLDPHKEASYAVHAAIGAVYSRLLAFKTGPEEKYGTNEVEGDLAEKWETSDDGKTWTFHLRQGVRFHDKPPVNGRELTTKDVLCTMDRIRELPGQQVGLLRQVADIAAPDDYTVVFTLTSPYASFAETIANPFLAILPCEAASGTFDPGKDAIGTGPFMLASWKKDQERVYLKHPGYFVEGKPHLDGYTTTVMPDAQAQIAALRSGKLDMMTGLSTEKRQVDALIKQVEGLQRRQEEGTTQTRVFMNAQKGSFSDIRVRRAVAMAIDKQGMVDTIRAGGRVTGPITPSMFGALPTDEVAKLVPYDPEAAKKLLAEAGYPDGIKATMVVTTGYGETIVREAQWIQEDLAKVGIEVSLDVQDYASYVGDTWPNTKYEIMYGLQTPMLSADEYLTAEYASDGSRNWSLVKDAKLDTMIDAQRVMTDAKQREAALQEIDRYIIENVSTPLPLFVYDGQTVLGAKIRGYHPHPDYSAREWQDIWMDHE